MCWKLKAHVYIKNRCAGDVEAAQYAVYIWIWSDLLCVYSRSNALMSHMATWHTQNDAGCRKWTFSFSRVLTSYMIRLHTYLFALPFQVDVRNIFSHWCLHSFYSPFPFRSITVVHDDDGSSRLAFLYLDNVFCSALTILSLWKTSKTFSDVLYFHQQGNLLTFFFSPSFLCMLWCLLVSTSGGIFFMPKDEENIWYGSYASFFCLFFAEFLLS